MKEERGGRAAVVEGIRFERQTQGGASGGERGVSHEGLVDGNFLTAYHATLGKSRFADIDLETCSCGTGLRGDVHDKGRSARKY